MGGRLIVIPRSMRLKILYCINQGHLGITKCCARARTSVWWPGISSSIEDTVRNCHTRAKLSPEPKETRIPAYFPSRPWERVGMDIFELKGKVYSIVVDYYSRRVEVKLFPNQASEATISVLKGLFATHRIPDIVMSDNGPQLIVLIISSSLQPSTDLFIQLACLNTLSVMMKRREHDRR